MKWMYKYCMRYVNESGWINDTIDAIAGRTIRYIKGREAVMLPLLTMVSEPNILTSSTSDAAFYCKYSRRTPSDDHVDPYDAARFSGRCTSSEFTRTTCALAAKVASSQGYFDDRLSSQGMGRIGEILRTANCRFMKKTFDRIMKKPTITI